MQRHNENGNVSTTNIYESTINTYPQGPFPSLVWRGSEWTKIKGRKID